MPRIVRCAVTALLLGLPSPQSTCAFVSQANFGHTRIGLSRSGTTSKTAIRPVSATAQRHRVAGVRGARGGDDPDRTKKKPPVTVLDRPWDVEVLLHGERRFLTVQPGDSILEAVSFPAFFCLCVTKVLWSYRSATRCTMSLCEIEGARSNDVCKFSHSLTNTNAKMPIASRVKLHNGPAGECRARTTTMTVSLLPNYHPRLSGYLLKFGWWSQVPAFSHLHKILKIDGVQWWLSFSFSFIIFRRFPRFTTRCLMPCRQRCRG